MILPSADELDPNGQPVRYLVENRVRVGGERLVDSQPSFQDNFPVVGFRFDLAVDVRRHLHDVGTGRVSATSG